MNQKGEKWLEYKGYVASVEQDPEDGALFGIVLNADNDLIMFEALTEDELQAHFQEAIYDYEQVKQQTRVDHT